MSVIGPRPGLWNQDLLTAERDKYGANDVKPGLTGWAQINGRDELEIPDKAIAMCCINVWFLKIDKIRGSWVIKMFIIWGIGVAFIPFIKYLSRSFSLYITKILSVISYSSFCLYLFHRQFYSVIYYIIGNIPVVIAYFILFPLLIVLCYLIQKHYDKILQSIGI